MNFKAILSVILYLSFCGAISAQQDSLSYSYIDENGNEQISHLNLGEAFQEEMKQIVDSLYGEGYWNVSLDEMDIDNRKAKIYKGAEFQEFKIKPGNLTQEVYDEVKLFRVDEFGDWPVYGERLRDYLGDLGYPFAQISLDSITTDEENIYGSINIIKGPQIKYDSIYYEGDLKIRPAYLMNYLQVVSGGIYRHSDILNSEKLLRALPFATLTETPKLKFIGEYASLHLKLNKKNASRFDFLVGVNPLNENNQTRFFITLDVQAELANQLNFGESISFRFSRLRPENQELEFAVRYPYLLDQPIALEGRFGLYRRSLEFQDVVAEVGADYILNTSSSIGVTWNYLASRLIAIDSLAILSRGELPDRLDVIRNGLAANFKWNNLDQILNPTKGWEMKYTVGASTKNIIENQSIQELKNDDFDFSNSFDTLNLTGYQLSFKAEVERYFPIGQNFALKSYLDAFWLISDLEIYKNEFARVGGNKLLRGFDEESILSQAYVIPGVALHVILDEYSFLSLPFVEYGLLKTDENEWTQAIGVGAGINFSTRAGMLNFSIAAGKLGNGPFDIARPKVHIGFLRLF